MHKLEDANWRKSSRSGAQGGACVEIAITASVIGVRDSKNPAGPELHFSREQFATFLTMVKAGEFDV